MNDSRVAELLAHHKLGWVIRARANKQLKFPGKGKYDDTVELTLEIVGPVGVIPAAGEYPRELALGILEKTVEKLAEQMAAGLEILIQQKEGKAGS